MRENKSENLPQSPPPAATRGPKFRPLRIWGEEWRQRRVRRLLWETLKHTRKWQSRHKLAFGNWNSTSLAGKEYELVEEAKPYSPDVVGISSAKRRGSNTGNVKWVETHLLQRWASTVFPGWTDKLSADKLCWQMDPFTRKGVHGEVGLVGSFPVFDTGIRRKCAAHGIRGGTRDSLAGHP